MIDTKKIQYTVTLHDDRAVLRGTLVVEHTRAIALDDNADAFANVVGETKKSIKAHLWGHAYGELVAPIAELLDIASRVTFSDDQARVAKLRAKLDQLLAVDHTV